MIVICVGGRFWARVCTTKKLFLSDSICASFNAVYGMKFGNLPHYFSIEDIFATQERLPCKFVVPVHRLGK